MAEGRRGAGRKKAGTKAPGKPSASARRGVTAPRKTTAKGGARPAVAKATPKAGRKAEARRARPQPKASRARRPRAKGVRAEESRRYPAPPSDVLSEEERIESAKYLAPSPARVFEEERFVFPETYGVNRVRLLVKDPSWLFVHWDVDPEAISRLKAEVGPRTVELSKLTLKVFDPTNGGGTVILIPAGARSWYVRADAARRAYRAELGLTLPSGEFRRLAESNTVVTPRVGPSPERARQVVSYRTGRALAGRRGRSAAEEEIRSVSTGRGPWSPAPDRLSPGTSDEWASPDARAGASDSFRPPGGASDVHRR